MFLILGSINFLMSVSHIFVVVPRILSLYDVLLPGMKNDHVSLYISCEVARFFIFTV